MREIEEARAALDRVENNLERYRWILRNPRKASALLTGCLNMEPLGNPRDDKAAIRFAQLIDQERGACPHGHDLKLVKCIWCLDPVRLTAAVNPHA